MGIGMARFEKHVYDPKLGLPASVGMHDCKVPSILDTPDKIAWDAVDKPDGANPVGSKGIGEPIQGSAASAVLCAISDALGGHNFNRTPVTTDMIINAAAGKPQSFKPLQVNV
jgi:CO/xanthine dehydrogenase Mo-binding subunit